MSEADEQAMASEIQARAKQVTQMAAKGQTKEAIKLAVSNPPTMSKNEETKRTLALAATAALKSAARSGVKAVVADLSAEEADTAMKFVFAAMATQDKCDVLLEWHNQLYTKYGVACIVRAVSERSCCPVKPLEFGEA